MTLPKVGPEIHEAIELVREGKFQRTLALLAGASSLVTGAEVAYEHYKGSYSQRVMVTPVVLSGALALAAWWGFKSHQSARRVLRPVAALTALDGVIGFYFHIRGVARKPAGWRLPMANVVMGPPLFAPLLFVVPAWLGLMASYLRREPAATPSAGVLPDASHPGCWRHALPGSGRPDVIGWRQDLREGRFQKHMAGATAACSALCGLEALYSHYKSNFQPRTQWIPIVVSPLLTGVSLLAINRPRVAHTWLPALSAVAGGTGLLGTWYHVRGILRRPGGRHHLIYNILYGPPIFAPMLFGACGLMGLLASLLRSEQAAPQYGHKTP